MAVIILSEAARRLNLSPSTLRHQIRNNKFKAWKIVGGRDWVTNEAEVEKYRERSARPADVAARYKGRTRKSTPTEDAEA